MARTTRSALLLAACGLACALPQVALAQPAVIHLSGATLLENLFRAPAATVDYIDADGNGIARRFGTNQQLAPLLLPGAFPGNQTWPVNLKWAVVYSAVGSTNGYQELINFGRTYVTIPGNTGTAATSMLITSRTVAYYNRYRYISGGTGFQDVTNPEYPAIGAAIFNANNPAGAPIRSTINNTFLGLYTSGPSAPASTQPNQGLAVDGGLTVDMSPIDVPASWATTQAGTATATNTPLLAGYGNGLVRARNPDGTSAGNNGRNSLASLTGGAQLFNGSNGTSTNTIFDTLILFAPVAPVTNFGTGISQMNMSDLQFLFATGRLPSGENLVAVTRDSGSGTRNAFDNSIGLDPSAAFGDNASARNNSSANDRLGAGFLVSNKGGNPRVEDTVFNNRLAIGYVGPERGISNGSTDGPWLTNGEGDIISIVNNLASYGATSPQPTRPTLDALLNNNANTGWQIYGPGVLATFGDPRMAPASKGGYGYIPGETNPGNAAMRNVEAAALINNFTRSTDAFISIPGGSTTDFTPGEFAALEYILVPATDFVKQTSPSIDPRVPVPNPNLNQALQDYLINESSSVYKNVRFANFGGGVSPFFPNNSRAGKVPSRTDLSSGTYSDGTTGLFYIMEDSSILAPGESVSGRLTDTNNLPLRNLIAADFNGDGRRDLNDAGDLIRAWRERTGGPNWTPPATANGTPLATIAQEIALITLGDVNLWPALVAPGSFSIEIVGDFNGDGNFNAQDLRYWADGLAMTAGSVRVLDRKAGFTALDNELFAATGSDANLFDTRLVTPCREYAPGDARGDVANASARVAPGAFPVGADGIPGVFTGAGTIPVAQRNVIDATDIDYVFSQFATGRNPRVTDGEMTWGNVSESSPNNPDATASDRLVGGDLSADINGDLKVNQADVVELVTVILKTRMGDVNLDGNVNGQDGLIIQANLGTAGGWARGDLDGDGTISSADLDIMYANACIADVTVIGGAGACPDLVSAKDGQYTVDDIIEFFNNFGDGTGCPGTAPCNVSCDVTGIGGWPELPDGQLTVDDVISFINAFSDGCL